MRRIFRRITRIVALLTGMILCISLAVIGAFVYINTPPPFSSEKAAEWEGVTLDTDGVDHGAMRGAVRGAMRYTVRFDVRKGESTRTAACRGGAYPQRIFLVRALPLL